MATKNNQDKSKKGIGTLAVEILRKEGNPLHYVEIYQKMQKYKTFNSKTPEKSVYSVLCRMKELQRVGRGTFALVTKE